jgi:hypothetical protein
MSQMVFGTIAALHDPSDLTHAATTNVTVTVAADCRDGTLGANHYTSGG